MLSVSLDCPFVIALRYSLTFICLVSCVPYVVSFFGLSICYCPSVFSYVYLSCVLCTLCCQFLWIVHLLLPYGILLRLFIIITGPGWLNELSDKVYQLLVRGRWFSSGKNPTSSTTKTGRHDIAEILLKVVLNTNNQMKSSSTFVCSLRLLNYLVFQCFECESN